MSRVALLLAGACLVGYGALKLRTGEHGEFAGTWARGESVFRLKHTGMKLSGDHGGKAVDGVVQNGVGTFACGKWKYRVTLPTPYELHVVYWAEGERERELGRFRKVR